MIRVYNFENYCGSMLCNPCSSVFFWVYAVLWGFDFEKYAILYLHKTEMQFYFILNFMQFMQFLWFTVDSIQSMQFMWFAVLTVCSPCNSCGLPFWQYAVHAIRFCGLILVQNCIKPTCGFMRLMWLYHRYRSKPRLRMLTF